MARTRLSKLDPAVRRRIMDAARHEFAAHGLDQASLNVIIERAGISKGVLYYYFVDKQDLYLAIIQEAQATMAELFSRMAAGREPTGDYWEDLRVLARQKASIVIGDPEVGKLMQDLYHQAQKPGDDSPFKAYVDAEQELALKFMQTGLALGKIRTDLPPETLWELSFAVTDVLDRHLLHNRENVTPEDIDRYADLLVDILAKIDTPHPPAGA